MKKQMIIAVSREFGSGGHVIAEAVAKHYGIELYDNNILTELADIHQSDSGNLAKFDEVPKRFLSRTVRGFNNSAEDIISNMQFDFMKQKAESGESFVIVGRCAETILKPYQSLISFFVLGDYGAKLDRICKKYELSQREAEKLIKIKDKKRKSYHNYNCDMHWGDSRNYDVCINSSRIGIDKTVEMLIDYIEERMS